MDGKTIRHYLDLLVDLLLVRQLQPLVTNAGKRLVKAPIRWEGFVLETLLTLMPQRCQAFFYRTRGLTALRRKMNSYQANGAQLGWLLIPHLQAVEIWPAAGKGEPERIEAVVSLEAGPLFPGLQIELQEIWCV